MASTALSSVVNPQRHSLKAKLANGDMVLGMFMNCTYPAFVEAVGLSGYDFCIIDMEHGPAHTLVAEDLCRAAGCVGLTPIVRIRAIEGPQMQRALDIGSGGVQVPQIESKEDALAVVKGARYTPLGQRGFSPYTRATSYGAVPPQSVTSMLNEQQLVVVHVEGVSGVQNLEAICSVDGIDVIFLGPYDLSQSLGIPGQVDSPEVVALMESSVKTIRAAGKWCGTFADSPDTAAKWGRIGVQYLAVGVDVGLFRKMCQEQSSKFRSLVQE